MLCSAGSGWRRQCRSSSSLSVVVFVLVYECECLAWIFCWWLQRCDWIWFFFLFFLQRILLHMFCIIPLKSVLWCSDFSVFPNLQNKDLGWIYASGSTARYPLQACVWDTNFSKYQKWAQQNQQQNHTYPLLHTCMYAYSYTEKMRNNKRSPRKAIFMYADMHNM